MKMSYLFLLTVLLSACVESVTDDTDSLNDSKKTILESDEEIIKRNIEGKLSIPATEKYSFKIYKEQLNGDDSLDYVITVNRLQKAIDEALESENPAKRAELGYIGNFNYIFYMDGANKEVSEPIAVPSSPHAELSVGFNKVTSEAYNDFTIDFRIRNSRYRRFYTVHNRHIRQVFESKIFDGLGTDSTEAYVVKFDAGSYGLAKDIVIYKGILEEVEIKSPNEVYKIDPVIEETDQIERRWFLNANQMKYFTRTD